MAKPPKPPKGGLSVGKAVMIGVLAVVLLVVIVTQFGGQKKQVVVKPRARRRTSERSEAASSAASTAPVTAARRSGQPWPKFDVAEVVASNPFLLPEVLVGDGEDAKTLTPGSETGEDEGNVAAIESDEVREMRRRQAEFLASCREIASMRRSARR